MRHALVRIRDPTTAAQAAAQWIIDQVGRSNYLAQDTAVTYLYGRFGAAAVTTAGDGTATITPAVRGALRTLGAGQIVWEAELRRWRRRERYDAAWRRAA